MTRRLILCLLALVLAGPAQAHKLKIFATIEDRSVTGYAFFVGGGRAQGSGWSAKDAAGRDIAAGETDAEGRFRFDWPDDASAVTITVDTHEAHVASVTLTADRLVSQPVSPTSALTTSASDADLPALVEAAVQRQVEPLFERIEVMDARLRLVDVVSGIFLIIGLAGAMLWARNRRI